MNKTLFNDGRKFIVFYMRYSVLNNVFYSFIAILNLFAIVSTVVLLLGDQNTNLIANSLLILLPNIISLFIIPSFMVWKLFSNVKIDGIQHFISSKKYDRKFEFHTKFITILIISVFQLLILLLLQLIIFLASGIYVGNSFSFAFLGFIASLFLLTFWTATLILITSFFRPIISLIVISIISLFMISSPIVGSMVSINNSTENQLVWNLDDNSPDYAKIVSVNEQGEVIDENIGFKNVDSHSSNPEVVNPKNNFGIFFDKLIITPYSSMLSNSLFVSEYTKIESSKKYRDSIFTLNSEFKGNTNLIPRDSINLIYNVNELNPANSSYESVLKEVYDYFKNDAKYNDLLVGNYSELLINSKLSKDIYWERVGLIQNEKDLINWLCGGENSLIYYLFRDWNFFGNKFKDLGNDLIKMGVDENYVDLASYLWTNDIARKNVLETELIFNFKELANKYPETKVYSGSKPISLGNLYSLEELVIYDAQNSAKIKVMTSDGTYDEFDFSTFPFKSEISTHGSWKNFIDANSNYSNASRIYEDLAKWCNEENRLRGGLDISPLYFDKNFSDIYVFDELINLDYTVDPTSTLLFWIILLVASSTLFVSGYYVYQRKDVR